MTRHIVLVHGAWQGRWAFEAWRPLLEARGWQVHAVDLPGNGWGPQADAPASLDRYTAHVEAVVRGIGAPVVLVGHSGGGITVSQVAEAVPERVAALVYLAGMMLPSQTRYIDVLHALESESPGLDLGGIAPWLDWNADRTATSVRIEGALRCFVHDCEPQAAQRAAALLRPQPESGRAMCNTLTPERFGRVPRFYVECADDQSLLLPIQRRMQQLSPGAVRIAMDCGHVPQLAQPERLTALLLPALDALPGIPSTSPSTGFPAQGLRPTREQMLRHLRRSNAVAQRAVALGHHPFGAVLVGPDQETVLLEQCNIDTVNHAESTLARVAASNFTPEFLWSCTLYTAVEPCCMCAGTAYWANIGRVVYGMTEKQLLAETGSHAENPTMSVDARYVFDHCQKPVELIGPVPEVVAETVAMQRAFWSTR